MKRINIRILFPLLLSIGHISISSSSESTSPAKKFKEITLGLVSNFSEISTSNSNPYSNYFREGVSLALENSSARLKEMGLKVITKEFNFQVNGLNPSALAGIISI